MRRILSRLWLPWFLLVPTFGNHPSANPRTAAYHPLQKKAITRIKLLFSNNLGDFSYGFQGHPNQLALQFLAHRNRSDFCDLRLRCPSRTPEIARFPRQEKAMLHCDLRVRWKVASDLRFRAAIFEPKAPSFCGIPGDLARSTRKSLAIAIVRFWCAKLSLDQTFQIPTSEKCSFGQVHGQFLPFRWSFTGHNLAVNAEEPCKNYKIKSDVLETLVILMPEFF